VLGIAYTIPDLDATVRILLRNASNNDQILGCVEAEMSNNHSVEQKAVAWITAVIAGLGLVASAVTSGLGHSNTAAHVAANAMSLFGYFQAQALIGMCAVPLPPIVASWTQNFQWSMGIIRVEFLQEMATWYQRATGGTPTTFLSQLSRISIDVQKMKRGLEMSSRYANHLMGRSNAEANSLQEANARIVLHGIKRVGFKANMETTNIFFTGYAFFIIFVILVVIGVIAFKYILEGLVKTGKMKTDKFIDFRNGWQTVLKGITFRIILISFPQMMVLCFWELKQRDSAGEVVLAIFTLVSMLSILGWATSKVIRIGQRSITMHSNPAYILYSDPVALNKWGFLYVQFKAASYYFIGPVLVYILIKAMFVGIAQTNGKGNVQAIALVLIEAALLIAVSVLRPYMDKKTNGFNIAICAVNLLSAIFLLFFTGVFDQPGIVTGIMGVIFFVLNAAFALILLLIVLVSSGFALFSKNPDTRYQPMRDDRGSFIKSQTASNTELDALGATARGEGKSYSRSRLGLNDDDSFMTRSIDPQLAAKEGHFSGHYQPASPRSSGFPAPSARTASMQNEQFRTANNSSPWQRGAGYDH
jgi:hypothetical protein